MRTINLLLISISASAVALIPDVALAYVGPGAGISVLGALWGLIVGVVLAVGMILFWPMRILLRKMKNKNAVAEKANADSASKDGLTPP